MKTVFALPLLTLLQKSWIFPLLQYWLQHGANNDLVKTAEQKVNEVVS